VLPQVSEARHGAPIFLADRELCHPPASHSRASTICCAGGSLDARVNIAAALGRRATVKLGRCGLSEVRAFPGLRSETWGTHISRGSRTVPPAILFYRRSPYSFSPTASEASSQPENADSTSLTCVRYVNAKGSIEHRTNSSPALSDSSGS
jgi:hypothetical protein